MHSVACGRQEQDCRRCPTSKHHHVCVSPEWMALVGRVLAHCSSPCHTLHIPNRQFMTFRVKEHSVRIPVSLSHVDGLPSAKWLEGLYSEPKTSQISGLIGLSEGIDLE